MISRHLRIATVAARALRATARPAAACRSEWGVTCSTPQHLASAASSSCAPSAASGLTHIATFVTRAQRAASKADVDTFDADSNALMDKLSAGLEPMEVANGAAFQVDADAGPPRTITITSPAAGVFRLLVDPGEKVVRYVSPTGDNYAYELNASTNNWEDQKDGHMLVEILTREIMRHHQGFPAF